MAYTYDEIMNSARQADAAGDTAAASRFIQLAAETRNQELKGGSKVSATAGTSPTATANEMTSISQPSLNISSEMAADPFTAYKV
jgi:predicted Zn-dependent protease